VTEELAIASRNETFSLVPRRLTLPSCHIGLGTMAAALAALSLALLGHFVI
jgi:hypothetical protein